MSAALDEAREALRARQGAGARYDATAAPAEALSWARLGTAYFARMLSHLADPELEAPSAIAGWSRRHVIAAVALEARRLAEAVGSVRGLPPAEEEGLFLLEPPLADIRLAATLPAQALRHLVEHAAIHLDVEWRDAGNAHWGAVVSDAAGQRLAVADMPRRRAATLWHGAVALRSGGRAADMPAALRGEALRLVGRPDLLAR